MKNVLLSEIGNNVYIIEGSRRTDTAAKTAIDALCARGIISPDLAERAKGDRATLDKIKKNMESVMFETTGDKWNFYTKSGLYMSIPANCEKYILVESTTGEETPTDDTKTPHSATDGATDGTTPASDPRQPDGATTGDTDGWNRITYGATTTPPRTACENAPQRTETGEGGQTTTTHHKTPPRGKYKATHARPPKFGKVCAKIRVPSGALYFTGAG